MAGDLIIMGGRPLSGTVRIPAAKNSVLPLLAALEQRELRVESLDVSGNALFDKAFCLLNPFVAGGHVRHLSIGGMKGDQAMVEGVCASLLLNRNLEECTIVLDDTPMDCADREAL